MNKIFLCFYTLLISLGILSCSEDLVNKKVSTSTSNQTGNAKIIEDYLKVYSERKDIDKIMSFYAHNAEYEDLLYKSKFLGNDIKTTFNWNDSLFKTDETQFITVHHIISQDSLIVAQYATGSYSYNNKPFPATEYTSWFYMNKDGKITKQLNYAAYPLEEVEEVIAFKKSVQLQAE